MSAEDNTLAGLAVINDKNVADINVSDLLQDAPVLQVLTAVPASQGGTVHKYLKSTVAAGAAFRGVNTGVLNAAGKDELTTVNCAYLDGSFHRDVAVADGFKDGRAAYMAKQTIKALKAMFRGLEVQMFLGVGGGDASGFVGMNAVTTVDHLADGMVVNAGGSGGKSVYLIRHSQDDVAIVAGNDGNIKFDFDPEQLVRIITDAATGAGYSALLATLGGWFGMQYGSIYSLGRIVNLDATTGHTLTDAMIAAAITKFPAGAKPNLIAMNSIALAELQASRTATNPTGAPAPFPTESMNVPIVETSALPVNESTIS